MIARLTAVVICASLLAACGGGGSSSSSVPGAGTTKTGSAVVRLTIPAASSTSSLSRSPKYVSPSTRSILITVQTVNGAATAFPAIALNVVVPSSTCPAPAQDGENETCTFNVVLPVGFVGMTVTTYDHTLSGTTPAGNPLSTAMFSQQLTGQGDPILLTLNGVPVHATLSVPTTPLAVGTAASVAVTATALDADGNLIIGPGSYATPIVVAVTDTLSRVTVSGSSISGPGASATLVYNGGAGLVHATVTGSASGVTVTPATLTFVPGLIRSDALAQITTPVHSMAISPDGTKVDIPYQNPSNNNAPALLSVSVSSRTAVYNTQLGTQAPATALIPSNPAFSSASGATTYVGYSNGASTVGIASLTTSSGIESGYTAGIPAQNVATATGTTNYFTYGSASGGSGAINDVTSAGSVVATSGAVTCVQYDQCLIASNDGALVLSPDATSSTIVTMHTSNGSAGPTISTPDGAVTAQTFSPNGTTLYLACAASGGGTDLDTTTYPALGTPTSFTTIPTQLSALTESLDATTLIGSSSLGPSPLTFIDIATKTQVSFGPTLTLGEFAGGFIAPVPLSTTGSRRILVVRQYQQPAGTLHTTLDEYVY
jgi:hypothetical protein